MVFNIGIITLILLSFLFYSKINFKKYINILSIIIIFILIFDVFVMTLFFGNARLVERLVEVSIVKDYIRLDLHSFGLEQFKNFWLFGYGNGAFEQIFKLFYILPETIPNDYLAQHVHNDGIELLGEVGVVGVSIFAIITIIYFKKLLNNINEKKQFARFILLSLLVFILFIQSIVDYSLQIPGIQVLLITIFSMGLINFKKNDS